MALRLSFNFLTVSVISRLENKILFEKKFNIDITYPVKNKVDKGMTVKDTAIWKLTLGECSFVICIL